MHVELPHIHSPGTVIRPWLILIKLLAHSKTLWLWTFIVCMDFGDEAIWLACSKAFVASQSLFPHLKFCWYDSKPLRLVSFSKITETQPPTAPVPACQGCLIWSFQILLLRLGFLLYRDSASDCACSCRARFVDLVFPNPILHSRISTFMYFPLAYSKVSPKALLLVPSTTALTQGSWALWVREWKHWYHFLSY